MPHPPAHRAPHRLPHLLPHLLRRGLILGLAWGTSAAMAQPVTATPPEPAPDVGASVVPGPTQRLRGEHRHALDLPGPQGRGMGGAQPPASRPQGPIGSLPTLADKRLRLRPTPSR